MAPAKTVVIAMASRQTLGSAMNDLRTWLDHHRVRPREFRPVATEGGWQFEFTFSSEDDARLFEAEFGSGVTGAAPGEPPLPAAPSDGSDRPCK